MQINQIQTEQIHQLVRPLVLSGLYKSEETALKDIILDFINQKLKVYQQLMSKMQSKYAVNFEEFSQSIKNKATTEQEDNWMDWKAAFEMHNAWSITLKKMLMEFSA